MGESTKNPQSPYMTLGTAAIRSITEVKKPFNGMNPNNVRGAYSLMNRAVPIETGNATTRAMSAMVTVPKRAASTPNFGWPPLVMNPVVVKNAGPIFENAGHD